MDSSLPATYFNRNPDAPPGSMANPFPYVHSDSNLAEASGIFSLSALNEPLTNTHQSLPLAYPSPSSYHNNSHSYRCCYPASRTELLGASTCSAPMADTSAPRSYSYEYEPVEEYDDAQPSLPQVSNPRRRVHFEESPILARSSENRGSSIKYGEDNAYVHPPTTSSRRFQPRNSSTSSQPIRPSPWSPSPRQTHQHFSEGRSHVDGHYYGQYDDHHHGYDNQQSPADDGFDHLGDSQRQSQLYPALYSSSRRHDEQSERSFLSVSHKRPMHSQSPSTTRAQEYNYTSTFPSSSTETFIPLMSGALQDPPSQRSRHARRYSPVFPDHQSRQYPMPQQHDNPRAHPFHTRRGPAPPQSPSNPHSQRRERMSQQHPLPALHRHERNQDHHDGKQEARRTRPEPHHHYRDHPDTARGNRWQEPNRPSSVSGSQSYASRPRPAVASNSKTKNQQSRVGWVGKEMGYGQSGAGWIGKEMGYGYGRGRGRKPESENRGRARDSTFCCVCDMELEAGEGVGAFDVDVVDEDDGGRMVLCYDCFEANS